MKAIIINLKKIDATNSTKFEEVVERTEENEIILDFQNVLYISSIGLRVLMKASRAGKKIKIINTNKTVNEILRATGLEKVYLK